MATVELDGRAFLAGLHEALADFDHQAESLVQEIGDKVAQLARGFAPQESGAIVAGIGTQSGRTGKGPYVDVGVLTPPADRHDFFQEFGTYKMKPHPFMRPALAAAGAEIRAAGLGSKLRSSKRATALKRRGTARRKLRLATKRGQITSQQARTGSRIISSLSGRRLRLRSLKIG
jgi:HK97 gp10 family phage protein